MTREQAETKLAERGMELMDVAPDHVLVVLSSWRDRKPPPRSLTPYVVAGGFTWQWAYAEAMQEAPW